VQDVRILIADDFEAWRERVRLILARRTDLQIVGEACNGAEAIQKAEELQPDLILLDVGMPEVNGIEAATKIRGVAPKSLILFLTLQRAADIAREAMNAGARGYVIKTDAESELLSAIEALLRGEQFISSRLKG
jgi:DNA-binding NarL/FixJ family response regulator